MIQELTTIDSDDGILFRAILENDQVRYFPIEELQYAYELLPDEEDPAQAYKLAGEHLNGYDHNAASRMERIMMDQESIIQTIQAVNSNMKTLEDVSGSLAYLRGMLQAAIDKHTLNTRR